MKDNNEVSESTIEIAADTLTGDIASFLVDFLRQEECAFKYLSEEDQQEKIEQANRAAFNLVERAVNIIAGDGRESIPVSVEKMTHDGKKIQVTLNVNKADEHRHALLDATGFAARLTVADTTKYEGGEGPQADADQPELPAEEQAA